MTKIANVKIHNTTLIPNSKGYVGDAGTDVALAEGATLKPFETKRIKSTTYFEWLDENWEVEIVSRSSTANKGMIVVKTLVDNGFTDEISVIVTNITDKTIKLNEGDCIAQAVPFERVAFANEDELYIKKSGHRGMNGFGSTGK